MLDFVSKLRILSKTYTEWWSLAKILSRLLILLVMVIIVLPREGKYRPARLTMMVLATFELTLDLAVRYSGGILNVNNITRKILKSILRFIRYVIEAVVFTTALLRTFQRDDYENEKMNDENDKVVNQKVGESFSAALENVKIQIETDRKERRANEDTWKQIALMSLKKDMHSHGDRGAMTPQQYSTQILPHHVYASPTIGHNPRQSSYMTPNISVDEMKRHLDFTPPFQQEQKASTHQYGAFVAMGKSPQTYSNLMMDDTSSLYESASEGGVGSLDSIVTRLEYESRGSSEGEDYHMSERIHNNNTLENEREEKICRKKRKALEEEDKDHQDSIMKDLDVVESCASPLKKQKQN